MPRGKDPMRSPLPLLGLATAVLCGCQPPPPAPEGLDEASRFVLREFYSDDATVSAGLTGLMTGLGLQFYTNGIELPFSLVQSPAALLDPFMPSGYAYVTSGKPIFSVPANIPVAFELTILFGGVLTVLGFFTVGRLYPRKLDAAYEPRFSAEEFGLVVSCRERDVAEIEALMRAHDAVEVTLVES